MSKKDAYEARYIAEAERRGYTDVTFRDGNWFSGEQRIPGTDQTSIGRKVDDEA